MGHASRQKSGISATNASSSGRGAEIAVDQIRTISKSRLGKKISALSAADAATLRRLITEMYGE